MNFNGEALPSRRTRFRIVRLGFLNGGYLAAVLGSTTVTATGSACPAAAIAAVLPPMSAVASLWAQQRPGTGQVEAILRQAQQQPALAEELRRRIRESGLTPDQIRARLRAAGYPETLLDPYLGAAAAGSLPQPAAMQLAAGEALGLGPLTGSQLPVDTGLVRRAGPPSRVFGVDVFRRSTTQFLPLLAGPVPPDYRVGPGDVLVLILTGAVELAHTLPVSREGFIVIPQVGQVFVANLTLDQLRELLYARLARVYSGVRRGPDASVQFDISVANVRVIQVYVVGEVVQPGAYQISALGTVLTALYAAGGLTERGNTREIWVQRGGRTVGTFDLYDYLLRGDIRSDIRLQTGDVIFVPVHGPRVELSGAVVRPMIYELKPGETLEDLLRAAGGFRPDADFRRISVHRVLPPEERGPGPYPRAVIDLPLSTVPKEDSRLVRDARAPVEQVADGARIRLPVAVPAIELQDGDSVVVDSVPPLGEGSMYVEIAGMVNKPGRYPWRPGMTLRELVWLARGPKVGALLTEAEIARLPEQRAGGALAVTLRVPLDSTYLFERDSLGNYVGPPGLPFPSGGAPEVELQPFDNVLILRQPDWELQRTVGIFGEVRFPGWYALRSKDEKILDLVERAGGLTPRAYADGVRFFRVSDRGALEFDSLAAPRPVRDRVDVDLRRALSNPGSQHNVVLQAGDSIFVPEYDPTVTVLGAVNAPASVLWREGEGLDYYISAAGGYRFDADKRRVSVRHPNGVVRTKSRFLLFSSSPEVRPGSEIFVPVRDLTQRSDYVALLGAVAQVLTSAVAILVVVTRR